MKLSMVVTNNEGKTLLNRETMITRNQLKRISAPELTGEATYKLKKNGRVEIQLMDAKIVYTLEGK